MPRLSGQVVALLAGITASAAAQLLLRWDFYLAGVSATALAMLGGWAASRADPCGPGITAEARSSAWPRHPHLAILAIAALALTLALQTRDYGDLWQLLLWIAAIVLVNAAYANPQNLRARLRRHQLTIVVVAVLVATALALRIYELEGLPAGFHADEGELGLLALDLVDGTRVRPFATGWDEIPTLFSYLQAAGISIAGENVAGVRMVSAVAGALTVGAVFLFLRFAAGLWLAIISAVVLTFSPWHIFFSRLASADFVMALLTVVVMLSLARAATRASAACYVLAGTAGGLCFYFANKAVVLPPTVAAAGLALLLVRPRAMARQLHLWLLALLVAIAVFAPQLRYYVEHDWYRAFFSHPTVHLVLSTANLKAAMALYHVESWVGVMAHQIERSILAFQYYQDAGPFLSFTKSPLLTAIEATFFVVGVGECVRRRREPLPALLLAWFAVGILTSLLADRPPQAHRMIAIIALPSIFAALAVDRLRSTLASLPFSRAHVVSCVVTILVVGGIAVSGAYEFFVAHPPLRRGREVTVVARAMRDYGRDKLVVPVNMPIMWDKSGTIRFIARGVQVLPMKRLDPDQPWQGPTDRDLAFLFFGRPTDDIGLLRRWYPHGVEWPVDADQRRATATIFVVPRADLVAARHP